MAFSKHLRITYHPFFATLIDELCTEDEIVLSVNITIFYLILLNQSILTDLLMLPKYFVHTAHKHFHSTIYAFHFLDQSHLQMYLLTQTHCPLLSQLSPDYLYVYP